ncbi:MAG TPA: peptidyl-prolyl cis-trans isomerase [Candidatus Limnocylindria bacterium]|nr:peptidyl-prolyl cis-trans isomerase [Candidatus Limnocylindria bacterium]
MLRSIQQRDLDRNRWIKITMTVILTLICLSMVITLIPGLYSGSAGANSPDTVASVGGQDITVVEVQRQLNQVSRGQSIPPMLKGLYAKQILDQLVFQRALELEAQRLGIRVTPEEETERIKQIVPTAFAGDTWLKDRYALEIQQRAGMTVEDFETFLRNQMLTDKFRAIVTDGISVSPAEIEQEFRRRNEKVQIEFALAKPTELAATIHPTDAELNAYYQKNASRYQVQEKRSARYALLDLAKLRARTHVDDAAVRAYYNSHIDEYKVQNRAHVEHILFKTIGKTDAEVAEIRAKAQDVLNKAKKGANFEDLAKKFSEDDATKPKGGDLGWIVEGQTVPEFQQTAFSLPKGSISDLVKTQYGFHIIKVLDRETAHTKPLEEVRDTIVPILLDEKVRQDAGDITNQMASAVRQSNRQPLEELAKKFNLVLGETPPASATDPIGELGSTPDLHQTLSQLRPGELSSPLQVPLGFVILTVKDIQPAHQGTLAEVHDRVLADYQQDQSTELARTKANELTKLAQAGTPFDKAAKSLGLEVKTSEPFSRTGSIPDVGSGRQVEAAFGMPVGQVSPAVQVGGNWLVYRVVGHQPVNPAEFAMQIDQIRQQLLQSKQSAAFDAFRTALEDRLKKEGRLVINADAMKRLGRTS